MRAFLLCAVTALSVGCLDNLPDDRAPTPDFVDEATAEAATRAWMGDHVDGWFPEIERGAIDERSATPCSDRGPATSFHVTTSRLELDVTLWCDAVLGPTVLRSVTVAQAREDVEPGVNLHVAPRAALLAGHERGIVIDDHAIALEIATSATQVTGCRYDLNGAYEDACHIELPFQAPVVARIELDRTVLARLLPTLR